FAVWQREWLQGGELEAQLNYWRGQLGDDIPVLNWPIEQPRPTVQSFRGSIHPFKFTSEFSNSIKAFAQREGITLFTLLTTAFASLLHAYTGQNDIVIGTVAPAGRKRSEVQNLIGYFLNPVALRLKLSGAQTCRDLLRHTREIISGALSHDDVP